MKEVYGSMALDSKEIYTFDDIMALPEDVQAELINGEIFYMACPTVRHQRIVAFLTRVIGNYIEDHHGDCSVFPGPFAVYFEKDKHNYLVPDVSVVCTPSQLTEIGSNGVPDLVMEIVSPSGVYHDYVRKLNIYGEKGGKEYWIIDPMKGRITVWNLPRKERTEYPLNGQVPVGIYDDLVIDFSTLKL